MVQSTIHPYVVTNTDILSGEPVIKDSRTTVRSIAEHWRMGETAEEIQNALPHLSLAEIFDALSFYHDNKKLINDFIKANQVPEDMIHPAAKA